MQGRGVDEFLHCFWIDACVLSQRPADGFVDEEFFRAQVLADDVTQEIKIRFLPVVELEQDRGTPEPEVI